MYYIYEIKGVKIGCTKNWEQRQKAQLSKGKMVLLETHTNKAEASVRERELQLEKGYRLDAWSYSHSVNNTKTVCRTPEANAKRTANTDWESLRAKQVANTDYSKSARGLREANVSRRKPIRAYYHGKYINTFESILKCSKELNLNQGAMCNVLNPNCNSKQHKGYTFEYL